MQGDSADLAYTRGADEKEGRAEAPASRERRVTET